MKVLINSGLGNIDYTRYVLDGTLTIEDAINVPTLITFQMSPSDNVFSVPKRSSYVTLVSEIYGATGGYGSGKILGTGFITTELERDYLGLNKALPKENFQQLQYSVQVTSDEWLLNAKAVPFIPAFVNQTDSQILAAIAQALCPGFFNTTQMASGTLVPYYAYDPSQTWSDIAKTFADANRYHYKVINRQIIYQPFGDKPLGIAYDEQTQKEANLSPPDMKTTLVTVPPVNDCIVIGDTEPQTNVSTYFIGDGFTSNFQLRHQVFEGITSNLLQDDWTEAAFAQGTWIDNDPDGVIQLADGNGNPLGALNIVQAGQPGVYTPQVDATYLQAQNGLELGGGLNLQHGSVSFNDQCNGIIGALYGSSIFIPGNCIAGFGITGQLASAAIPVSSVQILVGNSGLVTLNIYGSLGPLAPGYVVVCGGFGPAGFLNGTKNEVQSIVGAIDSNNIPYNIVTLLGTAVYANPYGPTPDGGTITATANDVLVTASGSAGIVMQPILSGQFVGPQVVSQINHQYVLQTWLGANTQSRFTRPYKNWTQSNTYGGNDLAASGAISFVITDVNLGVYVIEQQNPLFGLFPSAPPPVVTKYTAFNVTLPPFALYCLVNAINLNVSINYTLLSLPPQGFLTVQSLTGASGGNLPWHVDQLTPPIHYMLGFGQINQTAQISQQGEAFAVSFYTDDIPSVGARIVLQSWAAGQSIARVRDTIAVANEAAISGDDGVRSAIMTNLSPLPRTSDECEAAAGAAIHDREFPQFQGSYTVVTVPFRFENLFSPSMYDYPKTGEYLYINAPVRAITGQNFFANTVRIQVVELRQEVLNIAVDYGPDLYLEKLLPAFLEREQNLLVPTQTAPIPNYVNILEVLNAFLPTLDNAQVTLITNSLTGNYITVDLGAPPVTGCEVRNVDSGWGIANQGRVGFFTSQVFTLPRTARDQTWYLRTINGGLFSRFSKELRVVYPLVPSAPTLRQANTQAAVFDYAGDVRDIYGIEVRATPLAGITFYAFPVVPEDQIAEYNRFAISVPPNPYGAVRNNANVIATYNVPSVDPNFSFPENFQIGDIVYSLCEADGSFSGFKLITDYIAATGVTVPTTGGGQVVTIDKATAFFFPAVHGSNGSFARAFPIDPATASSTRTITSLRFNGALGGIDPNIQPMQVLELDSTGKPLGETTAWSGATQGYDMVVSGALHFPKAGVYTLHAFVDDGYYFAIAGTTLISGPPSGPDNDPYGHGRMPISGITFLGGSVSPVGAQNLAGFHNIDQWQISVPAAGSYAFEIAYDQWYNEQTLIFRFSNSGLVNTFYDPYPTALTPTGVGVTGLMWGVGWFDYEEPFPDSIGVAAPGFDTEAGTLQLLQRGPFFIAASGMIRGGSVTVPGDAIPWQQSVGSYLNSDPPGTYAQPVEVPVTAGDTITITYLGGTVNGPQGSSDAAGFCCTTFGIFPWPSDRANSVLNNCLLGVFLDASGAPTDSTGLGHSNPFYIGDLVTVKVPPNSVVLSMGANHHPSWSECGGSWDILVSSLSAVATIFTDTPHGMNVGDSAIVGVSWATFPAVGYPPVPQSGAIFCGIQTVTNVPTATSFEYILGELLDYQNLAIGSWQQVVAAQGVPLQQLNGLTAKMPPPTTLLDSSGIIIQRPVFAPSDLVVDFTQPDIAATLSVIEQLSPDGRVSGLTAYFFNLTWDYSAPTLIPSFTVPVITGLIIDDSTQILAWQIAQGRPTGYRIEVKEPATGSTLNKITIDNPDNPQVLQQLTLSTQDFFNNRLIKITPFDLGGDGVPVTIFHSASGAGPTGIGSAGFTECLDVRLFGAVGDGITDDTGAIQTALNSAYAASIAVKGGQGPQTTNTVVCVPSNMICCVTPQHLDTTPAGGFGQTAYCLQIGSGVTLKVDGIITMRPPQDVTLNPFPWVILENLGAYGTGDVGIIVEGSGEFLCNAFGTWTIGASGAFGGAGAIKFQNVINADISQVSLSQFNTYGVYVVNCNDTVIDGITVPASAIHGGYVIVNDKSRATQVISCMIDGSAYGFAGIFTIPGLGFVADYGSEETLVSQNTIYGLNGNAFARLTIGYQDGVVGQQYAGTKFCNNIVASGSGIGAYILSASGQSTTLVDDSLEITENVFVNNQQKGIIFGNLRNSRIDGNTIVHNAFASGSLLKIPGSILASVQILNNIIKLNALDLPSHLSPLSPVFVDGISTCTMFNPTSNDRQARYSWAPSVARIMGRPAGQSGYVAPPYTPDAYFAVTLMSSGATGGGGFSASGYASGSIVLFQNTTTTQIGINPYALIWPDKTVTYNAVSAITASGYGTWIVFVDDPYRDGQSISYGITNNPSDLATSAGRYYLGTIVLLSTGGGQITPGGNIPALVLPGTTLAPGSTTASGGISASGAWQPSLYVPGLYLAAQVLLNYTPPGPGVTYTFPANFVGSVANSDTAASGNRQVILLKNGVQFATITFNGSSVGVFGTSPITTFAGSVDLLTILAPSTSDVTFGGLQASLKGLRSS